MMQKGFTLIELMVVIAIIATLSAIILFSITQYINKGKDASLQANLAVLIPAGEVFYNNHSSSYAGFCDSSVKINAFSQIPSTKNSGCAIDSATGNSWAACAQEFLDQTKAFCVDSSGNKGEICNTSCSAIANNNIATCPADETNCQ